MYSDSKNRRIGSDDPFNKARAAKEAVSDREMALTRQREQEKARLALKLSNDKSDILRLRMELQNRERRLQTLQAEVEKHKRDISELRIKIDHENGNLRGRPAYQVHGQISHPELDKTRAQRDKIKNEREALDADIQRESVEFSALTRNIEAKKKEVSGLSGEVQNISRVAEVASQTLIAKKNEINLLQHKIDALQAELKTEIAKLEKLKHDADVFEREAANKKMTTGSADQNIVRIKQDIQHYEQEHTRIEKKIVADKAILIRKKEEEDRLTELCASLEEEFKRKSEKVTIEGRELTAKKDTLDKMENNAVILGRQILMSDGLLKSAQLEVDRIKQEMKSKEAEVADLTQKISQIK
jgi:chromosome segregation ATPase